jgi:membrane protein DedA with SNARE-associated domain
MIIAALLVLTASTSTQADEVGIPLLVMGLVLGMIVGFWMGRRWAERGRARFDGQEAMRKRRNYRPMGPFWPFNKW